MLHEMNDIAGKKIVIIDDEPDLVNLLDAVLRKEGFRLLFKAATGLAGIELCRSEKPDLIVLDVMLPDLDGFTVCQQLRQFTLAPIFFLSAKNEDVDKLLGLSLGGDDYITKPFSPKEVAYRMKAYFRRNRYAAMQEESRSTYEFGSVTIDEKQGEVRKQGVPVTLTAKEYQLLLFLARHPGQLFSKAHLYETVWGDSYTGYDNTVMVHMRHLREKLEDKPSEPEYLLTVRGLGYKLQRKEGRP
ncbi:DNA-binding response regulator [Paenibacillus elgii]|uniref:DNA-binding response regulator n=1 Tax=Paenibacillus elgii TaxID=189691 RepID=A0A2T6G5C7_9BACL|nr:response regulator transcription factor [Paenibacillus elgii]PUA39376.1 DNA-binding response regulator [Paenibacillus elgii]